MTNSNETKNLDLTEENFIPSFDACYQAYGSSFNELFFQSETESTTQNYGNTFENTVEI